MDNVIGCVNVWLQPMFHRFVIPLEDNRFCVLVIAFLLPSLVKMWKQKS